MTFKYDDSSRLPAIAQPSTRRTNMIYDPVPHPTPVAVSLSPAAPATDASGPLPWFIDALGNRVEVAEKASPDDADEPVVVIRPV